MRKTSFGRSIAFVFCILGAAAPAFGAEPATGSTGTPLGAIKSWSTEVEKSPDAASLGLTPESISFIQRINIYFNEMIHLEGRFVQTDPNNDQTKGRFYVQWPGRLRFD